MEKDIRTKLANYIEKKTGLTALAPEDTEYVVVLVENDEQICLNVYLPFTGERFAVGQIVDVWKMPRKAAKKALGDINIAVYEFNKYLKIK